MMLRARTLTETRFFIAYVYFLNSDIHFTSMKSGNENFDLMLARVPEEL
jgi:hypothetical protein